MTLEYTPEKVMALKIDSVVVWLSLVFTNMRLAKAEECLPVFTLYVVFESIYSY